MKIPKRMNIKGGEYEVYFTDAVNMPDGAAGLCNPITRSIYLSNDLEGSQLTHIFLHEIFHAVFEEIGLTQASISNDAIEIAVDSISSFVTDSFNLTLKAKGGNTMAKKPVKKGSKKGGK